MKRQVKQGMSVLLSAAMVLSGVNAGNLYAAENDDTVKTIVGFDELDEKVAVQTLTAGEDDENDIKFPKKIWADMIVEKTEDADKEETRETAETIAASEETEAEAEETEAEVEETEAEVEETEVEAEETEEEIEETEAEEEGIEAEVEGTEAETEETEAEAEETEAETEDTEEEAEETEAETEETEAEAEETEAEAEETEAETEESESETEDSAVELPEESEEAESQDGQEEEQTETEAETEETLEMIELVPAATASEAEKEEIVEETVRKTIKNVEWELNWTESTESEFDPSVPGTYVYEPIIPSEYEMDMDVELPQIKVVVEEDVRAARAAEIVVTTADEMRGELEKKEFSTICVNSDLTFDVDTELGANHIVKISDGCNLTITGQINSYNAAANKLYLLTLQGEGIIEINKSSDRLRGRVYIGGSDSDSLTVNIDDNGGVRIDEMKISTGAEVVVKSPKGIDGAKGSLTIENGGILIGENGGSIELAKNYNITGAAGLFNDQGKLLEKDAKVTVADVAAVPAEGQLTAGTYVWDGNVFSKAKPEYVPDGTASTEEELIKELEYDKFSEIVIDKNITLTENITMTANHILSIPEGLTLTLTGKIDTAKAALTLTGEGMVRVQGAQDSLMGRIYIGEEKKTNGIHILLEKDGGIVPNGELKIRNGATVEVNSTVGITGNSGKMLVIEEGGHLRGTEGAGIEMASGLKVTDTSGVFSDQGKAFTTKDQIVVGASSDTPADNQLTAGSYIWDDAAQKFVKAAPDPLPTTSFENGVLICSEQDGKGQGAGGGTSWQWDAKNNTLNINNRFVGAKQIIFAKSEPATLRVNGNVELNPDAGKSAITSAGNLTLRIDKPKNENERTPILTVHGSIESKGNVELLNDTQLLMEGNNALLNAEGNLTLRSTSNVTIKNEDGTPAIKTGGTITAKDQSVIKAESTSADSAIWSVGKIALGGTAAVTAVNHGDGSAMSSAPQIYENARISASTSPQGRPGVEYDPVNIADYKYIKVRENVELPANPTVDDIAKMADSVNPEDLDAVDDLIAQIDKLDEYEKKALSSMTLEKVDTLIQEATGIAPELEFVDYSGAASNMQIQPENTKIMGALVAAGLDTNAMGKKVEFKVTQVENAEGVYTTAVCEFLVDGVKQEFDFPVTVYLGLPSAYFPLSEDQIHQTGNGIDRWFDFTYDGANNAAVFVVDELSTFNIVRKGSGIKPPAGGGGGSHASGGGSGSGGGRGGATVGGPGAGSASLASGRWIQDEKGWWYQYNDQTYPKDGWFQLGTAGDWYYFDNNGYMATGWILNNGKWYYLSAAEDAAQGKMLTGWQFIDGKWYYLNEVSDGTRGAMVTDAWIGEYYVNKDGVWDKNVKRK